MGLVNKEEASQLQVMNGIQASNVYKKFLHFDQMRNVEPMITIGVKGS